MRAILLVAAIIIPFVLGALSPMIFSLVAQSGWQGAGKPWLQFPDWVYWTIAIAGIVGVSAGTAFVWFMDSGTTEFMRRLAG